MKFRLNNTHPMFAWRINGLDAVEIIPAGQLSRAPPITVPAAPALSAAAIIGIIDDRLTEDNDRDDAAYEEKTPNLLNIYRSAKL